MLVALEPGDLGFAADLDLSPWFRGVPPSSEPWAAALKLWGRPREPPSLKPECHEPESDSSARAPSLPGPLRPEPDTLSRASLLRPLECLEQEPDASAMPPSLLMAVALPMPRSERQQLQLERLEPQPVISAALSVAALPNRAPVVRLSGWPLQPLQTECLEPEPDASALAPSLLLAAAVPTPPELDSSAMAPSLLLAAALPTPPGLRAKTTQNHAAEGKAYEAFPVEGPLLGLEARAEFKPPRYEAPPVEGPLLGRQARVEFKPPRPARTAAPVDENLAGEMSELGPLLGRQARAEFKRPRTLATPARAQLEQAPATGEGAGLLICSAADLLSRGQR